MSALPILFVTASKVEFQPVRARLKKQSEYVFDLATHSVRGIVGDREVVLIATGMGAEKTASCLNTLLEKERFAGVVVTGFCGGLNPQLKAGDVVSALLSRDQIIATVSEKRMLFDQTGADAVDLESETARSTLERHKIPYVIKKVVLDDADTEIPHLKGEELKEALKLPLKSARLALENLIVPLIKCI